MENGNKLSGETQRFQSSFDCCPDKLWRFKLILALLEWSCYLWLEQKAFSAWSKWHLHLVWYWQLLSPSLNTWYTMVTVLLLPNWCTNNVSCGLYHLLCYSISYVLTNAVLLETPCLYVPGVLLANNSVHHRVFFSICSIGNIHLHKWVELLHIPSIYYYIHVLILKHMRSE